MKKADQPLATFLDLYKLSLEFENRSPLTVETNFKRTHRFIRWIEKKTTKTPTLGDLTPENVQAYVAYLRGKSKWDDNDRYVHVPSDQAEAQERVSPMDKVWIKPLKPP